MPAPASAASGSCSSRREGRAPRPPCNTASLSLHLHRPDSRRRQAPTSLLASHRSQDRSPPCCHVSLHRTAACFSFVRTRARPGFVDPFDRAKQAGPARTLPPLSPSTWASDLGDPTPVSPCATLGLAGFGPFLFFSLSSDFSNYLETPVFQKTPCTSCIL